MLLAIKQGISIVAGKWTSQVHVTLPVSLNHYSLAAVCTGGSHYMDNVAVVNKSNTGFNIYSAYNQGNEFPVLSDVLVIGFN